MRALSVMRTRHPSGPQSYYKRALIGLVTSYIVACSRLYMLGLGLIALMEPSSM